MREHGLRIASRATAAERDVIRFADGSQERPQTVIWATGFRADHSWVEVERREEAMRLGRHGRTAIPGLWVVTGNFLFPITPRALDTARDVVRHLGERTSAS